MFGADQPGMELGLKTIFNRFMSSYMFTNVRKPAFVAANGGITQPPATPTNPGQVCTVGDGNLNSAREKFNQLCSGFTLNDCDSVNGQYLCSNIENPREVTR